MKLASVNIGLPREVTWHGQQVTTAIFKRAVSGSLTLRELNLDGDRQADLSVHGGPDKAVYCYSAEHYDYWRRELPDWELDPGSFGENFTTTGLPETSVHIGDRFRIGSAHLIVTQPRLPCYKLGIRFESDDMVRRFLASGRFGFYVAVEREGTVEAGATIERLSSDASTVPVAEIVRLYTTKHFAAADFESATRALHIAALPESWKDYFSERLAQGSRARKEPL